MSNTRALRIAREFIADETLTMLVLSGPKGCGKTCAASWATAAVVDPCTLGGPGSSHGFTERPPILQQEFRSRGDGLFMDVSRLSRVSRYKSEEMAPLEQSRLLVIDDLGMEFSDSKGSFLATLDGIIHPIRVAAQNSDHNQLACLRVSAPIRRARCRS